MSISPQPLPKIIEAKVNMDSQVPVPGASHRSPLADMALLNRKPKEPAKEQYRSVTNAIIIIVFLVVAICIFYATFALLGIVLPENSTFAYQKHIIYMHPSVISQNKTRVRRALPTGWFDVIKRRDDSCGIVQSATTQDDFVFQRFSRIMHGVKAQENSWPWIASIAFSGPKTSVPHSCGGALINKRYVLTAAHCLIKSTIVRQIGEPVRSIARFSSFEKMTRVYLGIHDRFADIQPANTFGIEKIVTHPEFNQVTFQNDIALIKLDRDVLLTPTIGFICLNHDDNAIVPGDSDYIAAGWGFTEYDMRSASRFLLQVTLNIQSKRSCKLPYVDQYQFCAGNTQTKSDTCTGDSGGPLFKFMDNRWTLMGIISNGDSQCAGTGIYTNVSMYRNWINSNIRV